MRCSSSFLFFFCLNSRLISVSNIPKSPVESGQRPSTDIHALTHSEEDTFFFFLAASRRLLSQFNRICCHFSPLLCRIAPDGVAPIISQDKRGDA